MSRIGAGSELSATGAGGFDSSRLAFLWVSPSVAPLSVGGSFLRALPGPSAPWGESGGGPLVGAVGGACIDHGVGAVWILGMSMGGGRARTIDAQVGGASSGLATSFLSTASTRIV
eukprot:6490793-Amphidinium_carterae.5